MDLRRIVANNEFAECDRKRFLLPGKSLLTPTFADRIKDSSMRAFASWRITALCLTPAVQGAG